MMRSILDGAAVAVIAANMSLLSTVVKPVGETIITYLVLAACLFWLHRGNFAE